jgi:hypothetical protein
MREAVEWLEESCRFRNMLKEDKPDLLWLQHELAIAYGTDGQVQKAVELLEAVVETREKMQEADHPDRLVS